MKNLLIFISVFLLFCIIFYKPIHRNFIAPKPIQQTQPIQIEPQPTPQPQPPTISELLIKAHNDIRHSHGKPALQEDPQLMQIAQNWANHMAQTHTMRHQSMNFGKGWMSMGENIAEGQRSVEEVMKCWMHSPGHKRNILGNYTKIGVAVATSKNGTKFWCVDFGKN
jgi:uncharacterized protein YkwD